MKYISHIAFMPENMKEWKRIGKLFYDKEKHEARIMLTGYHQGICIAKPDAKLDFPFLQGDIIYPVDSKDNLVIYLWCGFITTSETEKGEDVYTVKFEALPFVQSNKIWLQTKLDDKNLPF